jgi:L-aminopeptidase/D-esterase-like protein
MQTIQPGPRNLITDVAGLRVGNAEDHDALTGVTVVIGDDGFTAGVDVRGGAPGTRETDALDPSCLVERVHAITLAGGSVFGEDAAGGVIAALAQQGIGFSFVRQPLPCPIVPAAIVFDLNNGGNKNWGQEPPYRRLGLAALDNAAPDFDLGNAGAGLGCLAGTLKGGLGSASLTFDGIAIGALVAVNSFGSVIDPRSGDLWARPFELDSEFTDPPTRPPAAGPVSLLAGSKADARPGTNTTIAVVATDAPLTKTQCSRLAIMAADGMARAIRPIHTPFDGDTVFALSTPGSNHPPVDAAQLSLIGTAAADTLTRAIARAICTARATPGHPAWADQPAQV